MNARQALESLLNSFREQGWTDRDSSALRIVDAISGGASPDEAAALVSRNMLTANGITKGELAEVVRRVVALAPSREEADQTTLPDALRVVVLTAIASEFEAVVDYIQDVERTTTPHGTVYYAGTVIGAPHVSLCVAEVGPGNTGTAVEAASAVSHFRPDLLLFVGVAGGLKDDIAVGDVVVATNIHYYEGGKGTEHGFLARPVGLRTNHRLQQLIGDVARQVDGVTIHRKPIAAGEQLIASEAAAAVDIIHNHYNDSAAVDMESGGLYDVAHRFDLPGLSIRGISDRLDDKSGAADAQRQPQAARAAAQVMAALLQDPDLPSAIGATRNE